MRLEVAANDPANRLRMQAYMEEKLSLQLPRTSRIRLIEELMETLDAVELSTELVASAAVGAQRMLREVMPMLDGRPCVRRKFLKPGKNRIFVKV